MVLSTGQLFGMAAILVAVLSLGAGLMWLDRALSRSSAPAGSIPEAAPAGATESPAPSAPGTRSRANRGRKPRRKHGR